MAFNLENISAASRQKENSQGSIEKWLKKDIILFGNGFSNKKKHSFYLELGVLLRAGITLKEALTLIIESFKKNSDKELFNTILQKVINGKPFSEALKASGKFSEYEYYSLKIGEETGTTATISTELASFYEKKNEQQRIIISALTYPSIVVTTAILVVVFMLSYVVPMFQDIFRQNKMELPVLTQIIVKLSEMVKSYGFFILLIIIGLVISNRFLKDNQQYKRYLHSSILKIPMFGKFITKVYLAQFTQAVALLTASKVPMLNSIQMVRKMINFMPLQNELANIENSILKGDSLSESMAGKKIFDARIKSLVKVAEETNQTEYIFKQLHEQYSQEVIQQSKIMSTVLEPFIILFVGVVVAVLLIAMYLPMFQLSSAIG